MRANVGNEGRWNGGANIAVRKDKQTVAADVNLRHDANHSQFDTTLQGLDPVTHLPFSQATHGTVKGVSDYQGVHGSLDYDLTPKARLRAGASYSRYDVLDRHLPLCSDWSLLHRRPLHLRLPELRRLDDLAPHLRRGSARPGGQPAPPADPYRQRQPLRRG